ncbi:MAG: transporter [Alphaproteobacteria bacterium]|nr:transporter [Alphaproteobacteria bacterium]NCQ87639.1 transporter [Alphaproteobacteria bacterium]NCT05852.1 transporter [Alphaproteobacteria bacterium]
MKYLISFILLVVMTGPAQAQNVSSPSISKGKLELNNRLVYRQDNNEQSWDMKNRFEYGVTERFAVTFAGEFEKDDGNSAEIDKAEFRAMYLLTDKNDWMETAIRGVYDVDLLGDADSVGLELLGRKKSEKFTYQFNIDTAHDVGDKAEDGVELDFAFGLYRDYDGFRVGPEYYWDLGRVKDNNGFSEQAHQFGPAIVFDVPALGEGVQMELAYFRGISDAAQDNTFKYELDIEF